VAELLILRADMPRSLHVQPERGGLQLEFGRP